MYAVPQPYWEDDAEAKAAAAEKAENLSADRSKKEWVVCKSAYPGVELIRSDCGTQYLAVRRKEAGLSTQSAASPAQFAAPTPYWETAKA